MRAFRRLIDAIEAEGSAALVTLTRVEGSSPREAGARMVVRPSGGFHGTIGGGALEWAARRLADNAQDWIESAQAEYRPVTRSVFWSDRSDLAKISLGPQGPGSTCCALRPPFPYPPSRLLPFQPPPVH